MELINKVGYLKLTRMTIPLFNLERNESVNFKYTYFTQYCVVKRICDIRVSLLYRQKVALSEKSIYMYGVMHASRKPALFL